MKLRGILKRTVDEYTICCINCRATKNIKMISHRNDDGLMVGWIFACDKCSPSLFDKRVVVSTPAGDDIKEAIAFLDGLGEIANGDFLRERIRNAVRHYASQIGHHTHRN